MPSTDDRRRLRFWQPDSRLVTGMFRLEREDRIKTMYADHFMVVAVYEGAFDGWYRGAVHTHTAGAIKLKEPGEIHRDLHVHAPFTLQGAGFSHEAMAEAAAVRGLRGSLRFRASSFGPRERATRLAFAMLAALVDPDAPELERSARVAETLDEVLAEGPHPGGARGGGRAGRAVGRARAFLHDALADKITLDDLAVHAGLDKFHLVRAFRAEVGLPPYEYLTHARIAKARELLQRGSRVADAAQAVGFCDESQLHRHFRRILGITPGQFSRSFGPARRSQHRPIAARRAAAHWAHDSIDSQ